MAPIECHLKESFSDVVYQCPLVSKEQSVLISFILEHKSKAEAMPHLQLLRYMIDGWEEQIKQKQALNLIIPIVVYHGQQQWHQRDLSSYFGFDIPQSLLPFLPQFDYLLTNIQNLSKEHILELNRGLLINTLLMFKYIWDTDFILKNHALIFIHLDETQEHQNFIISLLAYLFKSSEIGSTKAKKFIEQLPSSLNKDIMSTYDQIVEEGISIGLERGIAKGIEQGIEKGIEQGIEKTLWYSTTEMIRLQLDESLIMKVLHVDQIFIDKVKSEIERS